MGLGDSIKKIKGQFSLSQSKDVLQITKNWYNDRYEGMQVQRNSLALLMVVSCLTIMSLVFGILYFTSKTTIEPFVIEIEPKTGVTTVVYPLDNKALSDNEAIKKYFIWKYVKLREEYFFATFDISYSEVGLYSEDTVYGQYRKVNNKYNQQSPYILYGPNASRQIELKSLSFLKDNVAQIRFRSSLHGASSNEPADKIATIEFVFDNQLLNEEQRLLNPLGFKIKTYTVEEEFIK